MMFPCRVEGCNNPHHAKFYCAKHYAKWKKYGDPLKGGEYKEKDKKCAVCERKATVRGLCGSCYQDKHEPKEYAVYKGEHYLTSGNLYECAEWLGVKIETMRFYTTPVYKRRINQRSRTGNCIIVMEL